MILYYFHFAVFTSVQDIDWISYTPPPPSHVSVVCFDQSMGAVHAFFHSINFWLILIVKGEKWGKIIYLAPDDRSGLIDILGRFIISPKYSKIFHFSINRSKLTKWNLAQILGSKWYYAFFQSYGTGLVQLTFCLMIFHTENIGGHLKAWLCINFELYPLCSFSGE